MIDSKQLVNDALSELVSDIGKENGWTEEEIKRMSEMTYEDLEETWNTQSEESKGTLAFGNDFGWALLQDDISKYIDDSLSINRIATDKLYELVKDNEVEIEVYCRLIQKGDSLYTLMTAKSDNAEFDAKAKEICNQYAKPIPVKIDPERWSMIEDDIEIQ